MGLFVLSNALRVKPGENRLALPGGKSAEAFWSEMAGDQSKSLNPNSFEFLEALAAKDDGKLNYLYLFSYFLSNDAVKALFFDFDVQKMKEIYQLISLNDEEKINDSTFPRLDDWSYFTLIYALKTKNGAIDFPHGAPAWFEAMKGEKNETAVPFDVIKELLAHPGNGDKTKELRKFMSLYTKFYHRPQLLAGGGLSKLYTHYQKYNGLVDFMEKIPLKKPETLVQLLDWVQTLESLDKKDERLFTTIYQSLFELLSFTGKYAPFAFDYDHLVSELIKLPTDKAKFYRGLFQFFKKNMGIEGKNKTLTDAILIGIKNPTLKIVNSRYIYLIKDKFKESLNEILKSQEVCAFSTLLEIDRLLEQGLKAKSSGGSGIGSRIIDIFHLLPHPGISADAPRNIRHRVVSYSPSKLNKAVKGLALKIRTGSSKEELMDAIDKIKGDYLIWQLKDHLLALAYAVNAKDANLKAFLNPNLVRLHDIDGSKGVTSWNNWGKEEKHRFFSEYHLSGGLSRLNITLTSKWKDHLFKNNIVYNVPLVQAVIQNLLDFYPLPLVNHSLTYTGLLVQLGMDLIHYAGEDEVDDENTTAKETVKKVLMEEIGRITSGYHYRRFMDYLNGKSDNHNLFFSEIKDLGEAFLHHPGIQKVENIGEISTFGKLEAFQKPPVSDELKKEMHWFGSIYSQTFGNLRPQEFAIFPQEVASLFSSGWLSGARVEEFKVKVAYHLYKKKIPPDLLGQLLYMYLRTTCGKFLRQNHFNDYSAVYLIFTIFNTSHLNQQIKKLKKEGYLKLK